MHFRSKNSHNIEFLINYETKNVTQRSFIKFLGLTLGSVINWKMHIDNMFSKPATVIYTIRILKQTLSKDILIMTYFAFFHFVMEHGIIFGTIPDTIIGFLNYEREY
jgi:hypothetical protein